MQKNLNDSEANLSERWFYFAKGETKGPFQLEVLLRLYTSERLKPFDLVRSNLSTEWRSFQDAFMVSDEKPLPPVSCIPTYGAFFLSILPLISYAYIHIFYSISAYGKEIPLYELLSGESIFGYLKGIFVVLFVSQIIYTWIDMQGLKKIGIVCDDGWLKWLIIPCYLWQRADAIERVYQKNVILHRIFFLPSIFAYWIIFVVLFK